MRAFLNWAIKNLSNIFSFAGILLTLYFGIYYVPNWLRESQNEKIKNAKINLEQSIKELVYSDTDSAYQEIDSLVKAKEIELNESFPLTREQVLTLAQESFMQDKFLPLEKRKELINEIQNLKKEIPPPNEGKKVEKSTKSSTAILELSSILTSIVAVLLGLISFFFKFRLEKEKQEEIDNQLAKDEELNSLIPSYKDFEREIIEVLKSHKGIEIVKTSDDKYFNFDIEFLYKNKTYFVEVKYLTKSKIGLGSFQKFLSSVQGLEGEFWFIYNTGLTEMVKRKASEVINQLTSKNRVIKIIQAIDPDHFKSNLENLLNEDKNITN